MLASSLVDRDVDDLLRIRNDGKIRIVRHEDDLPSLLGLLDKRDEDFVNALIVLRY